MKRVYDILQYVNCVKTEEEHPPMGNDTLDRIKVLQDVSRLGEALADNLIESVKRNTDRTNDDVMTLQGLAIFLKLNKKTIEPLVRAGTIPGFKIGASWRFLRSDIIAWMKKLSKENPNADNL